MKDRIKKIIEERMLIYEMINASCELAAQKGPHPLDPSCSCIACINKRKQLLHPIPKKWKYYL